MNTPPRLFDVCMVCALPEEARALMDIVCPFCDGTIEEHSSPRYQYSSRTATIRNTHDEPLSLHISWLPRYGPTEMTLHLTRVLEECQPRLAVMTGICAGDAEQVKLGDLVVAERTFTSDSGKFTLNEHGKQVHLHDTQTYQLDAAILQFLGLFDDWKPLVATLPRPPTQSEASREGGEARCHLKAMASGSAVRADRPFEDVRVPVRGTAAIDMEGAAFALAASRHHHTPWLVVKGVCDYADQHKNDTYHDYAARASAAYALSFLQTYVTNERLPRRGESSPASRTDLPHLWNIPYPRNPVFTGREDLLAQLARVLQPGNAVALSQPHIQAISGLSGIGKTQLALEYTYRYHQYYQAVFWTNADTRESLVSGYVAIAELLNLPQKGERDQTIVVQAVVRWLKMHTGWLLILDNADALFLLNDFLPSVRQGHILLTTRTHALGRLANRIDVGMMDQQTGTLLLLRRAGLLALDAPLEEVKEVDRINAQRLCQVFDGLPLAIDQAGAYVEETQCSLQDYQQFFQEQRSELLKQRGGFLLDHPDSVFTTFSLSISTAAQRSSAVVDLLRVCALLHPDAIPEELFHQGASHLGPKLVTVCADFLAWNKLLATVNAYSLLQRQTTDKTLSVHRLVQAVVQDSMSESERTAWLARVITALETVFPEEREHTNWSLCERLVSHALNCSALTQSWRGAYPNLASLLSKTARYLADRAQYLEAEPLYVRALHIWEQAPDSDLSPLVTLLNNLAMLYRHQGKSSENKLPQRVGWGEKRDNKRKDARVRVIP